MYSRTRIRTAAIALGVLFGLATGIGGYTFIYARGGSYLTNNPKACANRHIMKGYKSEELFEKNGRFKAELAEIAPRGEHRMSANPHGNGGLLLRDLRMPDFRKYAIEVKKPGATDAEATRAMGKFLRDVMKLNLEWLRGAGPE